MTRQARGYTWRHPEFEPGNRAAKKRGAYSPRSWRPLADAIAAELPGMAPWSTDAAYGATVAAWARVEAQLQLVMDWLDERGPLDDEGVPRPATNLLAKLESQAAGLRSELGLTPFALARLLNVLSAVNSSTGGRHDSDLEALVAKGAAIVAAHMPAALEPADDDDDDHEADTDLAAPVDVEEQP
jgi:hypothetical protein